MQFSTPLVAGRLVKRYKRFLADVTLDTGETITATCSNTGSMMGLTTPGARVWLSTSDSPTRKYRHTWELIETDLGAGPSIVGINTALPNKLAAEAIAAGLVADLAQYPDQRREVRYGINSRIDILLECTKRGLCYVEVKNVHMMRTAGLAEFPDSVTDRGAKHLSELATMVRDGHRAVMVFLIQRGDAERFTIARDVDPAYGEAFDAAIRAGVEAVALKCRVTAEEVTVTGAVPVSQ